MIAVGVARPRAHGQLITSTDTAWPSATEKPAPRTIQTTSVRAAIPITAGTNTPAMRSATRSMGALVLVASSTRRTIAASVVSWPTAVASMANQPLVDMVAPVTRSPTCFSVGTGSPVIALSSTSAEPSTTTPSTGTPSPARTTMRSPTTSSSAGTVTSASFRTTVAVLGARSTSAATASVVLPLARASKYLPRAISVKIMPAESRYSPCEAPCAAARSPAPNAQAMR